MNFYEMIDAYLSGDLTTAEKAAFQEALKKDALLRKEFDLHTELDAALSETDILNLRTRLSFIHQKVTAEEPSGRLYQLFSRKIVQLAAAVIVLLMMSVAVYQLIDNQYLSAEELYEMYYQPDDAVMFMRSGMDGADGAILIEALRKYEAQDYQGALELFKKDGSSALVHLYSGLAYMEIEMYDEAIHSFRKIREEGNSLFVEQASWYQGLCYLKIGQVDEARELFTLLSAENSAYKPKIDFILSNLKKL